MKTILINRKPIAVASIEFISGDENYSNVHLVGGEKALVSYTLKRMGEQLPEFVRIHKQTLVNPAFVQQYQADDRNDAFVLLTSGRSLAISRRKARNPLVLCKL